MMFTIGTNVDGDINKPLTLHITEYDAVVDTTNFESHPFKKGYDPPVAFLRLEGHIWDRDYDWKGWKSWPGGLLFEVHSRRLKATFRLTDSRSGAIASQGYYFLDKTENQFHDVLDLIEETSRR